jgi:hypothetical protein
MKYNKQRFRHNPEEGVCGDCYRTAIACIMDKEPEEVPHFYPSPDTTSEQFNDLVDNYLKTQGLIRFISWYTCSLDEVLASVGGNNPNCYWILSGTSPRNTEHAVVCLGGNIIHDPALNSDSIPFVGPCANGSWQVEVLAVDWDEVHREKLVSPQSKSSSAPEQKLVSP